MTTGASPARVPATAAGTVRTEPTPPISGRVAGNRIRAFRNERRLSLREVARRAELSPSLVSGVERGIVEPSISSLRRIAEALDISIFYLLDDRPAVQTSGTSIEEQIVRAADRRRVRLPDSGLRYELLCADVVRRMEAWVGTLEPGASTSDVPRGHPSDEFMLILAGATELEYNGETVILEAGDSIYIDGTVPHCMRAVGPTALSFLSVLTPPAL